MKKMLWIVNPHAGRGAMRGKLIDCILTFQEAGFDVTLHVTEGPEDATRVAQARAGEFDRIVCAGGDGTLNEVVTGLMQSKVHDQRFCYQSRYSQGPGRGGCYRCKGPLAGTRHRPL